MVRLGKLLIIFAQVLAVVALCIFLPFPLVVFYTLIVVGFLHYRKVRQEEFLHLLIAAAESGKPLHQAMWAYVAERQYHSLREFWVAVLQFVMLPGYYWFWHRRHSFERKVEQVALLLESGLPLHQALLATPGVAARETVLAAAIGQASGKLAYCLKNFRQNRFASVWLDLLPRFLYPLAVILTISAITTFIMIFIIPKFQKIFEDFKLRLPVETTWYIQISRFFTRYGAEFFSLTLLGLAGLITLFVTSATACWFCPGLGRIYRMQTQGRLLKILGFLLEVGKPVPEALALLAESGFFTGTVQVRLRTIRARVEAGEPLAESLHRENLLPENMAALLHAAEKAHHVPWALMELGETLSQRAARIVYRLGMTVFPLLIFAVALLVASIALAMFKPLLDLMEQLGT